VDMKKIRQFRELIAFYVHKRNYFGKIITFVHNHQITMIPLLDQQFQ
jgi:hypothetical protein